VVGSGDHDGNRKRKRPQIKLLKIADPGFPRVAVCRRLDTDFALAVGIERGSPVLIRFVVTVLWAALLLAIALLVLDVNLRVRGGAFVSPKSLNADRAGPE
jgi:hypothetical protein